MANSIINYETIDGRNQRHYPGLPEVNSSDPIVNLINVDELPDLNWNELITDMSEVWNGLGFAKSFEEVIQYAYNQRRDDGRMLQIPVFIAFEHTVIGLLLRSKEGLEGYDNTFSHVPSSGILEFLDITHPNPFSKISFKEFANIQGWTSDSIQDLNDIVNNYINILRGYQSENPDLCIAQFKALFGAVLSNPAALNIFLDTLVNEEQGLSFAVGSGVSGSYFIEDCELSCSSDLIDVYHPLAELIDFVNERDVILDLGCGTGLSSKLIGHALPDCTVLGVDMSHKHGLNSWHTWATANNQLTENYPANTPQGKLGVDLENVHFLLANGKKLPFPDGSINHILIGSVLHHLTPAASAQMIDEINRVLKVGGSVIIEEQMSTYRVLKSAMS